ncbi:hypothetical protein [uncultured Pseudonocardia sp.]|uniref:hypothetical protein n=1 Tax=uncultured Pseudonocardia sp. TaxID=211455 RepID=UPI00262ACD31|nr:hypothetical protein [uncultured Pseudonocardia sp.]
MFRRAPSPHPLLRDTRRADRLAVVRRYWLPVRLADIVCGRRDGRRGLPESAEATQWMRRVAAQSREGCQSVRRAVDRLSAPLVRELHGFVAGLAQTDARIVELTEQLDDLGDDPSADELNRRGPAESGDSDAVVAARARRRHSARVDAARATRTAAVARRDELAVRIEQARADLDALHAVGRTQAYRVVEHHRRRTHVYLRALVHRHPERGRVADLFDRHPLDPPAWATRPSPWTALPEAA